MRVLIATLGSRGDVQPMVALAAGLHARGHAITFCGPTDARPAVEARALRFVDLGIDAQRFLHQHPELAGGQARSLVTTRAIVHKLMDQQFHTLEPLADDADLVLGAGLVSAPSSIAEARRIPYRFIAFGSMAIPSRLHAPYLFPVRGLPGAANLALWRAADVALRIFVGGPLDAHRRRLGLPGGRRLSRVLTAPGSLLLAADAELSPPPVDYDPAIAVTGALRGPASTAPLPAQVESFLADGPPPVYIGFGSMTDPEPARTTRVIVEAIASAGVRAIVSSGWAGLGASLPSGCVALGEVPHDALFPRVAGIVHHGGAGTTATAARAGVPQVIVPHLLDQFYWAGRVEALGIGPRALPRRSLDAARLAARLKTLVADDAMRAAACALGDRLRHRDGVAAAVAALETAVSAPPAR